MKLLTQLPRFLMFMCLGFMPARRARSASSPWVISGHKGRIYEDNCRALHEYITSNTDQEIIWISCSDKLTQELRAKGHVVLTKHSFEARSAILRAPALIYSHGEDDLDNFMILWRKWLGKRFLLWHGLNHLKGPLHHRAQFFNVDFDWLLASSDTERKKLELIFPDNKSVITLGGGAHLDRFIYAQEQKPDKLILYFPTHRETAQTKQALHHVIKQIGTSEELRRWLRDSGYRFAIGRHINSSYDFSFESDSDVFFVEPDEVLEFLFLSELLISDYSALLSALLLLNRPTIFFPFDLDEYLMRRSLHVEYENFRYGLRVNSFNDLVDLIVSENWRSEQYMNWQKRAELKKAFFPMLSPSYSKTSYKTIKSLSVQQNTCDNKRGG